jgi:hypothetical protein
MALTGRADGPPLGPPNRLVPGLRETAAEIARWSGRLGCEVVIDPLRTLTARAAIAGFSRQGTTSCGGATRLLPVKDGWVALALARDEDVELLPAWLECERPADDSDLWDWIANAIRERTGDDLEARATLLGLPVGVLPARRPDRPPTIATGIGDAAPVTELSDRVAVDLSSLWAGPLCGRILSDAGLRVIKVESTSRPDGARQGPAAFFDLLNAGKESIVLDFRDPTQRAGLRRLVSEAAVVIEASRPRALAQLEIEPGPQHVWISITGYGRAAGRVAFGDDAAVGGGLVCCDEQGPVFCADAVADPVTGMTAAAAALAALARGGRWLLDVSMAAAAGRLAGPTLRLA